MFGVIELTVRKMKEPAFTMMLCIGILLGYMVAGIDPLAEDQAGNGLLSQILASSKGYPLMTSSFFGIGIALIMAVFTGATEIPRDIDTGMIMLVISKPISKTEYLIGKYLGVFLLCAILFAATELTIFITHFILAGELYPIGVMLKQFYLLLALLPLTALTVAISSFLGDVSAMIIVVVYLIFSLAVSAIPIFVALLPKSMSSGIEAYLLVFYYFFPNFIYYFQNSQLIGIVPFSLLLYSLSITVILLAIAALRLKNRDLI